MNNYLVIIAVICAFIVKGMCGFANTLVFTTVLSFSTNNINISPLELLIGYPSNFIVAWKERKSISAKVYMPLSLLVIAGSIPGALFLKNGNSELLKVIFGVVVVLISVEMFFREYRKKTGQSSKVFLAIIGTLSGILCGLFGVGAFLAAYVSRTTGTNSQFKGNICIVFIVENTFRIIFYSITGIINLEIFKSAVVLLPFMLAGLLIGMGFAKIINEKLVKKIIIILLALSGLSLIISNVVLYGA